MPRSKGCKPGVFCRCESSFYAPAKTDVCPTCALKRGAHSIRGKHAGGVR
jgi:hypothetical protein